MWREQEQNDPSCLSLETMLRHVIQPERMTEEQCEAVSRHVARCSRCASLYEALCDTDADLWDEAVHLVRAPAARAERTTSRQHRWPLVLRFGGIAAAACLVIAIGWFPMHKGNPGQSLPGIAANGDSPAVFAELVTPDGRKPLALNEPVATDAQPQEILLGGKHRVVMNRNTKATFTIESKQTEGQYAGKIPYQIQLAQGELYVEVVPGNPFTVKTANARMDITGTQFDVLTDGEKTDLTLLKGSIRFSALDHPQGAVSVTTGHASTIAGRLAPTSPALADALAATAWAKDEALRNVMASRREFADTNLQALSAMSQGVWRYGSSSDLDKLDYEKWRDEHRQSRVALAALAMLPKDQALKADWIEVMMVSGDIWHFHYAPTLPDRQPLAKPRPQAITRLARHYGLDEKDILNALGLPKSTLAGTASVQGGTHGHEYSKALRRWHCALLATVDTQAPKSNDSLKAFSFNASLYLSETRIAAYLWAKTHPEATSRLLADKEYLAMLPTPPAECSQNSGESGVDAWLIQLREEATAARNCLSTAMEWLLAPSGTGCTNHAMEQQCVLAEQMARLVPCAPSCSSPCADEISGE